MRSDHTLFLHGFMGSRDDWDTVIGSGDTHPITIDLPGHNGNKDLKYQNIENYGAELLKKLPKGTLDVVGYSMGGRVALQLLALAPERFGKAIIISAAPYCPNPDERFEGDQKLLAGDFKIFLNQWYSLPLFGKISEHPNFHEFLQRRLKQDQQWLQTSLNILSVAKQKDLRPELQNFKGPLYYISGELDSKYVQVGTELIALCKNGEHIIAPDCGHNVLFEQPELIKNLL